MVQKDDVEVPSINARADNRISVVSAIVSELVGDRPVDPDDNFFDIGGTSLLAVRLLARLRTIDPNFSMTLIFESSSVRQLALNVAPSADKKDRLDAETSAT